MLIKLSFLDAPMVDDEGFLLEVNGRKQEYAYRTGSRLLNDIRKYRVGEAWSETYDVPENIVQAFLKNNPMTTVGRLP